MNDKTDASDVQRTVSLLASRGIQKLRLFVRRACGSTVSAISVFLLVLAVSESQGSVTVSIPASLQQDFISQTTAQWVAEVKPGLFSGDYKITIKEKNTDPAPVPQPITTATAVEACLAHGVGDGMDYERTANVGTIYGLQAEDALDRKCGGFPIDTIKSTTTLLGACMQTYNNAANTINLRWGQIFDSEGKVVK